MAQLLTIVTKYWAYRLRSNLQIRRERQEKRWLHSADCRGASTRPRPSPGEQLGLSSNLSLGIAPFLPTKLRGQRERIEILNLLLLAGCQERRK